MEAVRLRQMLTTKVDHRDVEEQVVEQLPEKTEI
jgi:hypothetical protein